MFNVAVIQKLAAEILGKGFCLGDAEGRWCFGEAVATEFRKTMQSSGEEAKE